MSAPLRHLAIEQALADWFRRDGWEVSGRIATRYVDDFDDDLGSECSINLSDLANELDAEWDRIGGGK